jgi:hypothetical protein
MDWTWGWTAVGAIATCVLAAGIGVAIWQIIETRCSTAKQLNTARLSTNAHVAIEISRELRSEENLNALREIYSYRPEHLEGVLDKARINKVESVVNRLSMLASFVVEGLIDEAIAIETIGGVTALRCWYQLHSYVREAQRNRGSHFGEYYEDFVRRSLNYFKDAGIQVWFSREGETGKMDLLAELQKEELWPRSLDEIRKDRKKVNGEFKRGEAF